MNNDYLADVYKDFFGSPLVSEKQEEEVASKTSFPLQDVDTLLLDEESKDLLKKIFEYMRKYHEKEEERYLDFHFVLRSDNVETIHKFEDLIKQAISCYQYVDIGSSVLSFYEVDTIDKVKDREDP